MFHPLGWMGVGALLALAATSWNSDENAAPSAQEPTRSVEEILESYVEDFRFDPFANTPVHFGIRVKDAPRPDWNVIVYGREEGAEEAEIELYEGPPDEPTFIFVTDLETLGKLDRGQWNALTASGKAWSTDFAPLDTVNMPGFEPPPELLARLAPLTFHFWTRGFPEIIPFGRPELTRSLHGADGTLFYYQPGIRLGAAFMQKGQHVNEDPQMRTNPFPSAFIMISGEGQARIGGRQITLRGGQMVYVGPGVTHEFWNEKDEPAQAVLVMFGEGA